MAQTLTILCSIITLAYIVEIFKGSRTVVYVAITAVLAMLPVALVWILYSRNHECKYIKSAAAEVEKGKKSINKMMPGSKELLLRRRRIGMKEDRQVIYLEGRISSTNAGELEEEIFQQLDENSESAPVFDASKLEYISSAGLRVLMKVRKKYKETIAIREVSAPVYDIFETTGFTDLFDVQKVIREISIDGCKVVGIGFVGKVYRIDEETIVKVYNSPDAVNQIRHEKEMARAAFVKGIPTAISYDMVKVGDKYGSVFEMLDAKTYNDMIKEEPQNADKYIHSYVDFLKTVHKTVMDEGEIPSAKENFTSHLEKIEGFLSAEEFAFMKGELEKIPDSLNLVHGDFQMKNVMILKGEPMLIDMDTLCTGQPEFDLAPLYTTYVLFGEDDPNNSMDFLGIPNEMSEYIWEQIKTLYYEDKDEKTRAEKIKNIRVISSIWFLYILTMMSDSDHRKKRIARTRDRIREMM